MCGGQGAVNNMQRTPFGVFNNVQTCPNCRGVGQEVEEYCPTCKGKGANSETKEVNEIYFGNHELYFVFEFRFNSKTSLL